MHPGRTTIIVAHGMRVANPAGFEGLDFATFPRLSVTFDAMTWLRTGRLVLPMVEAEQPVFNRLLAENGQNDWTLSPPASATDTDPNAPPAVVVGDVVINGGISHVFAPPTFTSPIAATGSWERTCRSTRCR